MKEQLELKEIVGYLPYGLKLEIQTDHKPTKKMNNLNGLSLNHVNVDNIRFPYTLDLPFKDIKPILFPISLFKDINSNEMNELNVDLFNQMELCDLANKKIHFQNCNHSTILICLENKIDFQNLIEKGLAIEVTEEFNPYK
jgi:hypothetical protein